MSISEHYNYYTVGMESNKTAEINNVLDNDLHFLDLAIPNNNYNVIQTKMNCPVGISHSNR